MSGSKEPSGNLRQRLAGILLRPFMEEPSRREVISDLEDLRRHRTETGRTAASEAWFWWEIVRYAWAFTLHRSALRDRVSTSTTGPSGLPARIRRHGITGFLGSLSQDLRYAVRGFARTPSVSLVALTTIALAIGANSAIFSFADALLLRPLPVRDPESLVSLLHVKTTGAPSYSSFSFPDYLDLRDQDAIFSEIAAYCTTQMQLGEGLDAEPVEGQVVSGNYFSVLGVVPMLGRGFLQEEDRTPGTHPVAVISHSLWERRFGAEPSIIGRAITLNRTPFTVVGVMPPETPSPDLHSVPEVWAPIMMHPVVMPSFQEYGIEMSGSRGTHWLDLMGRLRDGVDRDGARAMLRTLAQRQAEEYPDILAEWSIALMSAGDARTGPPSNRTLLHLTGLLLAVVGTVLLIAYANVANLLLVRSASRRQEMGIRLAIGAPRRRLFRQVLTEALTLSLLGGVAGILLAAWSMSLLGSLGVTAELPGLDVRLDMRVLGFALGLSVLTGVVFGLAPALQASADAAVHNRRDERMGSGGRSRRVSLRQLLVAFQVALCLVLLIGAGLTLRTLQNLRAVPLGFDTEHLRIATVDLSEGDFPEEQVQLTYRQILNRIRSLPGVRAASLGRITPFGARRMANDIFWERGGAGGERERTNADMNVVDGGYFQTMGIPVLHGRVFSDQDVAGAPRVVVVNETLAARLWPEEDPLGKRLWLGRSQETELEVVGIVADGRYYRSWKNSGRLFAFLPLSQNHQRRMSLHIRGAGPAIPTAEEVRRQIRSVEPSLPLPEVTLVSDAMAQSIAMERTSARLLALFGLLATVIAAIGVYGVVSYSVSERTHEMGVRIAMGAGPLDVHRAVITRSLIPLVSGLAVGWLVSLFLTRFITGLLFGVSPADPPTFAVVAAMLGSIGLAATFLPAHRATRIDPLQSLRAE